MRILSLILCLSLSSCGLYTGLMDAADSGRVMIGKLGELADKGKARADALVVKYDEVSTKLVTVAKAVEHGFEQAKKDADTDGDGVTTAKEWLLYALGGGGAAALASWRRVKTRNAESDTRKSRAEARLDALEAAKP